MGRFLQQLGGQGGLDRIEITAHGQLADFDLAYIKAGAIKGLLSDVVNIRVNLVNAALLAERRGIDLVERKIHQHEARYENLLSVGVSTPSEDWRVRGSVIQGEPYIVGINDQWVDFPASGNLLADFAP